MVFVLPVRLQPFGGAGVVEPWSESVLAFELRKEVQFFAHFNS